MIKNGFGHVLTDRDGQKLRSTVYEKLQHPRHLSLKSKLNFDEMLSGWFVFCCTNCMQSCLLYAGSDTLHRN